MLKDLIDEHLVKSMKEKNQLKVSTLRMINSSIKDLEISLRSKDGHDQIHDNDIINILVKMVKQRKESAETYKDGGREDLYQKEIDEINIIEEFMPNQLSNDETKLIIVKLISDNNISDMSGMGKIMSLLKDNYSGQIDLSLASKLIKEKINS